MGHPLLIALHDPVRTTSPTSPPKSRRYVAVPFMDVPHVPDEVVRMHPLPMREPDASRIAAR
jgi:hypothetical protein